MPTAHPDTNSTQLKIFKVAAHLFALKGYDGVSMREISEQSGVSKPTIYYYFGNKEGIYRRLIEVGMQSGNEEFENLVKSDLPVKEKLKQIMLFRLNLSRTHPDISRFFVRLATAWEPLPFRHETTTFFDKSRTKMVDLIREGISRGEFGPQVDPELAVDIFAGILMHFIRQVTVGVELRPIETLTHEIIELYFRGLNE
ncbi:TetR/AcrR family transcriptional regulator [candidate division KSB1 bacterium]|nr:TetR/AcrR family transcriptional regulator [candidate division KSB1 bacterium]